MGRSRNDDTSCLRGEFQIVAVDVIWGMLRLGFMMISLPGWPEELKSVRWIDGLGSSSMMVVWVLLGGFCEV